jgi:hypothetical protein
VFRSEERVLSACAAESKTCTTCRSGNSVSLEAGLSKAPHEGGTQSSSDRDLRDEANTTGCVCSLLPAASLNTWRIMKKVLLGLVLNTISALTLGNALPQALRSSC